MTDIDIRHCRARIEPGDGLQIMAARLYPYSEALQAEWLRAVSVVRGTSRGWLLDKPVTGASHAKAG